MAGTSKKGYERGWPEQSMAGDRAEWRRRCPNNGGPWRARMNSRAPRQKEKKKRRRYISLIYSVLLMSIL